MNKWLNKRMNKCSHLFSEVQCPLLCPSDSPLSLGKKGFFPRTPFRACVAGALRDALSHLAAGVGVPVPPMLWAITFLLSLTVRQVFWGAVLATGLLTWGGLVAGKGERCDLFHAFCPVPMSTRTRPRWALDDTSQLANHILHSIPSGLEEGTPRNLDIRQELWL